MNAEEFRNRKMVVTVSEHCEHCKTLQKEVKPRTWSNYYYGAMHREVKMTSCQMCFDQAVQIEENRNDLIDPYSY